VLDPRLATRRLPALAGRRVVEVTRSGKRVLVGFSAEGRHRPLWLAVHLRMTGRLLLHERPVRGTDHLRARFTFDRGELLFVDPRRFGTFDWFARREDATPRGIDPLSPQLTARTLADMLRGASQNVKAWLLRQDRLVGVGNIYASEILHQARIAPTRRAGTLTRAEIPRLLGAIRGVLERAIDKSGTTFSDFQDARGIEGSFQHSLAVYGREHERCRRCKGSVRRIVQQQRSTFWCPGCQR
jgi:formamidopyrimidine-DNA glycosylase